MKYKFNQQSLSFEKVEKTVKQRIKNLLLHLATAIAFATIILIFWSFFFDSPKEKQLKREVKEYNLKISQLEKKVDILSQVLNDYQEKDKSLYRSILEANPQESNVSIEALTSYNDLSQKEALTRLQLKTDLLVTETQQLLLSYCELWKLAQNKKEIYSHIPAISPVKNPQVISGFGPRYHPIYKILRPHTGIDIIGKKGTPIYATADGTICNPNVGTSGYGILVAINHGNGYQTIYAHLSKKNVHIGQKVKRGEVIGYMGNSGLSSGVHVHYEVIKNGVKVNPIHYFFADITPEEYDAILKQASEINQSLS